MKDRFIKHTTKTAILKQATYDLIDTLPDTADGVKLVPGSLLCGKVSFSALGKGTNLSPEYYLTHKAKQALKELVRVTSVEHLEDKINRILDTGRMPVERGRNINLPPNFLDSLKQIWAKE
jgi:hypothetical protein